jgi:hypothetical protein
MRPSKIEDLGADEVRQRLSHAGLMLLAFELIKEMVVGRVKFIYADTEFEDGLPFKILRTRRAQPAPRRVRGQPAFSPRSF